MRCNQRWITEKDLSIEEKTDAESAVSVTTTMLKELQEYGLVVTRHRL